MKQCDYCPKEGEMPTFMDGETICIECLRSMPADQRSLRRQIVALRAEVKKLELRAVATPAAQWRVDGQPDPHDTQYDCERAKLMMGHMTDDEFANGMYLYDHRCGLHSIAWLTAGKERIRWLSRALERAKAAGKIDVDWLSNVIRSADGSHSLGAGELAERIVSAIAARNAAQGGAS